jgi:hypothetical protein
MSPTGFAKILAKEGLSHRCFAKPKPVKCLMWTGIRGTQDFRIYAHFAWPYAGFLFRSAAQAYTCGYELMVGLPPIFPHYFVLYTMSASGNRAAQFRLMAVGGSECLLLRDGWPFNDSYRDIRLRAIG